MELAEEHITVNAYAPGIVGTAMVSSELPALRSKSGRAATSDQTLTDLFSLSFQWDLIDEELGKKKNAAKGDTIKKYSRDLIILGRTSEPRDVAGLVSFLGSKDSDYMTGQT